MRDQQQFRSSEHLSLLNPEINSSDVRVAAVLALSFLLLRLILEKSLFRVLFRRYPPKSRRKLSENLFYTVYYIASVAFYVYFIRSQVDWTVNLFSNKSTVIPALLDPFPPPMTPAEHFYYAQSAGFYAAAAAFLLVFDTKRSDYNEMLLHHCVTGGLVGMSYAYGYVRAGIIIIAVHDFGDIFLNSAKFLHYLGMKGYDTAVFAMFAIVFYITRLVMYPRVVYAIFAETLQTVVEKPSFNKWAMFYDTYLLHYLVFNVLLPTLLALHCFWFALILRMIYREVVLGKKISDDGDIRSDDEDDNENEHDVSQSPDDDSFDSLKKEK